MGAVARIFDASLRSYDSKRGPYHIFVSHFSNNCIIRNNHKKIENDLIMIQISLISYLTFSIMCHIRD